MKFHWLVEPLHDWQKLKNLQKLLKVENWIGISKITIIIVFMTIPIFIAIFFINIIVILYCPYLYESSTTKESRSYLDGGQAMTDWPLLQEKVYCVFSTWMNKSQRELISSYYIILYNNIYIILCCTYHIIFYHIISYDIILCYWGGWI